LRGKGTNSESLNPNPSANLTDPALHMGLHPVVESLVVHCIRRQGWAVFCPMNFALRGSGERCDLSRPAIHDGGLGRPRSGLLSWISQISGSHETIWQLPWIDELTIDSAAYWGKPDVEPAIQISHLDS